VAITKMDLMNLLRNADGADVDFPREGVRVLAQALMEVEVSSQIGAEHGERAPERRSAQRNGYRERDWDTRAGTIELQVPRLRQGSYFPSILDARRRAEKALCGVVAQCYVEGVSTRRVDDIAKAMGIDGISKSQVSRICGELDEVVAAWRNRPLDAGPAITSIHRAQALGAVGPRRGGRARRDALRSGRADPWEDLAFVEREEPLLVSVSGDYPGPCGRTRKTRFIHGRSGHEAGPGHHRR
jgi:hypothetical protein